MQNKGISFAVETVIVMILAAAVLAALLFFFRSQWSIGENTATLLQNQQKVCGDYLARDPTCDYSNYQHDPALKPFADNVKAACQKLDAFKLDCKTGASTAPTVSGTKIDQTFYCLTKCCSAACSVPAK